MMGTPGERARKKGTGQIRRMAERYGAFAPATGKVRHTLIGWFPNRHEATRALDAWLAQQSKVA